MVSGRFGYVVGVFATTGEVDGDLARLFLNSFMLDKE